MEAHHASLGRRKLEEIRQKKAADRSQKVSTGMDPMSTYSPGLQKTSSGMEESASWIGYQSIEREFQALSTYSKQLEAKIAEQQEQNQIFASKEALRLRQQEQQRLAEEKERFALLVTEKELLQEKLEVATKKSLEPASEQAGEGNSSTAENKKHEKGKHDQQLRDLALMVERLENGRQKIIAEIDAQSLEIERLFVENASLSDGLKEMTGVAAQWESQVQECLKQNAELRVMLDKLRTERVNTVSAPSLYNEDAKLTKEITEENLSGINGNGVYATENSKLKAELAKTQTKAETLAAQVMQLSVELKHTVQAYNGLTRLYNPVLWNIENRLIQMKADSFVSDAVL